MVVVISAVVGVVASLVTTNISGDVSLSPDKLPGDVIADACNGDGVCEMNNALIAGSLEANSLRIDRNSGYGLKIDQGSGYGLKIDQDSGFGLRIDQGNGYGLMVTNEGSGYALAADGKVMFKNLQGTGPFLCIGASDVIFRSNSSCN